MAGAGAGHGAARGQQRGKSKKLIDWARWHTSADGIGPGYCKHCKQVRDDDDPCADCPEPAVFPDNVPVVELFQISQTQWRVSSMGSPIGFDYAGVEVAARLAGMEIDSEKFAYFQVLERAYITGLRDGNDRNTKD